MKPLLATAALLSSLAATPALAQDRDAPEDVSREMEEGLETLLSDPTMPDRMAAMTGALLTAMEAMPLGEIEATLEGRTPTDAERARRLGDEVMIDREMLADQTRHSMAENQDRMRSMVRAIALMAPTMARMAADVERAMDEADASR